MSTIDPSSQLLAQIRAQALAWKRRAAGRGEAAHLEGRPAGVAEGAQDWLVQVAQAVVAIRQDDPQRQRKAFRFYLQAALARECGIRRVDGHGFQSLVDRVQETMESDPKLRGAMHHAGEMLLKIAR
jgi:hypothetical protein